MRALTFSDVGFVGALVPPGPPALSAYLSSYETGVYATGAGTGSVTVSAGSSTAYASGGTAPYTYSWSKIGGSSRVNISGSTTSATANFVFSGTIGGGAYDLAQFECLVTDAASNSVTLGNVDVVAEIYPFFAP